MLRAILTIQAIVQGVNKAAYDSACEAALKEPEITKNDEIQTTEKMKPHHRTVAEIDGGDNHGG